MQLLEEFLVQFRSPACTDLKAGAWRSVVAGDKTEAPLLALRDAYERRPHLLTRFLRTGRELTAYVTPADSYEPGKPFVVSRFELGTKKKADKV